MQTENTYVETDLGNIALNPRGEYSGEASYEHLDTVSYMGGSYVCLAELTKTISGIAPAQGENTEHWQMLTLPGQLTPEAVAMHDDVVNKAKQVETSRAAVELSQQEVEAAQADVTQMRQDTQEASEEAIASRDSAAGYAQSAEASRTAAAESEQNINAQVAGFDTHVAKKTSEAESAITEARRAAVSAVSTKQDNATQAVTDEGDKQIKKVEDAGTEQVGKAKSAGASAVSAAGAAGMSAVNAVKAQQTASIKAVADEGTQQVTAVNTAGSTQVSTIETKGADRVKAIQEAGKNALQNISNGVDKGLSEEGKAADAKATGEAISKLTEELSNLLEEGTQILDWKNAKVVNGYFTSISDFKSSDVSRTVIIPVDYSKGDTISIHRGIMGERFVCGYTSIEMPKIGDILDYANVQNNAERVILRIKSDTKNILLYYYNSTLDNYDSDDILASIMVQYGKVYTGYEPYGEPRGKKDIINKINGNSEKLISAVYNSPSIFDDVSNPISKGDHFYLYVKDIVGAKYSDIEFYFFRSDNTYKRVIHNINIGELYAITADEDYTKYRIRIVVESTTSNDMIYAIYNIFQSNGISAINISAKVYDLALDNNKKVEQLTANNLNTCNIFRKVIACGDSYTAGYIVSKTGEIHNVNEEYAWPHYMETITGNTWVNCGHSGANAYTWQTAERGLPKAKASGKAQAYILGLMINDSSTDSTRNLKLGTISDIGTDEISYYGQYTKIIKELFNISPNAKVFIETCPKVEGDRYIGYNQAVYDIYDKLKPNYPNLHLLDLFKHYSMYTNASLTKDSLSGHYTAIGYQQFAQILSVILSSYINEHISDFQDVAFIEYDN